MIGREDIRAVIEESQELHGGDDAKALRELGVDPRAVEEEARYLGTLFERRRVPYRPAIAASFQAGVEIGLRLAKRQGRESS